MERELLGGFSIFEGMEPASLDGIARHCAVLEFERGDEVFRQDTEAEHLYGVLQGEVDLILVFSERILRTEIDYEEALTMRHEVLEKPIVVETLEPGDVFGWSSIIVPPGRWSASARCGAATRVFSIPAAEIRRVFDADPRSGYRFMSRLGGVIAQRLHHRTAKLIEAWGEAFGDRVL